MNQANAKARLTQVLLELKVEYLEKFPAKLARLREITQKQDWQKLEDEYHKLKGTGKTYGFPEISIVCQQLETMAQCLEGRQIEYFEQALTLLEKIHQSHLENQPFDLKNDSFARSLLALKVN